MRPGNFFLITFFLNFTFSLTFSQNLKHLKLELRPDKFGFSIPRTCSDATEIYSGILIYSLVKGFKLEISNLELKKTDSIPQESKYFFCFEPFTREKILTISKEGFFFEPMKIQPFEGIELRKFELIVEDNEVNYNPAKKGEFYINTMPSGADIFMEGNPDWMKTTPFTFKNYEAKKYSLVLKKENYKDEKITIKISDKEPQYKEIKLQPIFGQLNIKAGNQSANNALVKINGKDAGSLPLKKYMLQQGFYEVVVQKKGYSTVRRELKIMGERDTTFLISLYPVKTVFFESSPDKAKVGIDGKYIGKTPLQYDLSIGTHLISISKDNFKSVTDSLRIKENDINPIKKTYSLKEFLYSVEISSTPIANLLIDNGESNYVTGNKFNVPYGRHHFRIYTDEYFPKSFTRKIIDNRTYVHKNLHEKKTYRINYVNGFGFDFYVNNNKITGIRGGGIELGGTISYFSLSAGMLFIQNNIHESDLTISHAEEFFPFDTQFTSNTNEKISQKDSMVYGYFFKGGIVILKPFFFILHGGYGLRQGFKYNRVLSAKNDFIYTRPYSAEIKVMKGEFIKGATETENYKSAIVGIEVPILLNYNLDIDYWLGSEVGPGFIFGMGINF